MERPIVLRCCPDGDCTVFLYIFVCRKWRFIEVKLCLDILSASFKVTFGYMGCSYHNVHSWKRCFWSPDQNRYQSLALFSWKRRTSVKLRDAYESGRWLLNGDSRSTRTRLRWERVCVYDTAGVVSSLVLGQKTSNISCLGFVCTWITFHKVLP